MGAQPRDHPVGIAHQPPPGDADDAVAGELQYFFALAVLFEWPGRHVVGTTVELDDDLLLAPDRVDELALAEHVHLRTAYGAGVARLDEEPLDAGVAVGGLGHHRDGVAERSALEP